MQNIVGFLHVVAYVFLVLGIVLAFFTMGISLGIGLGVFISIMITLPLINGMKDLVVYTIKNNLMMEEMLELAKKQSQKEPESNKEAE